MSVRDDSQPAAAVYASFINELEALKPGNVSRYAGGHDMTCEDFVRSAEVVTPILCRRDLGVGARILVAAEATQSAVGCNTNLGMLLLFAPLIRAWEIRGEGESLLTAVRRVLAGLDREDAAAVYAAIRTARPAGLGQVPEHDVNSDVEVDLHTAMAAAREHDLIALQYYSNFEEIFFIGLISLEKYKNIWKHLEWATVGCYLTFMSRFPDSHVGRKHGRKVAEDIQERSKVLLKCFDNNNDPEALKNALLDYDRELKNANINPGTSADLTAASLLLYHLGVRKNSYR